MRNQRRTDTQRKLALLLFLLAPATAEAQLFGTERNLGQPLSQRPQAGRIEQATEEAGQVQGDERFLRDNRRGGDFVGSDRFEQRTFVGNQQGTTNGPVVPSTTGVRPNFDRSQQINQTLQRPAQNQPYHPRLELGFGTGIAGVQFPGELKRELENPDYFASSNRYEVLVEGRQATLRGVVADARQRDLAELLVSFEPGIAAVKNELRIANSNSPVRYELLPESDLQTDSALEPPPPPVPAVTE